MNTVRDIAIRDQLQSAFLDALEHTGSMTAAADAVGIARDTPYGWLTAEGYTVATLDQAEPTSFAGRLLRAKSMAAEHALGRLHTIMDERTDMPAAVAAMFTVKRWYPEYREQIGVTHSGTTVNVNVDLAAMPPADRARLFELAASHERQKLLDHPVSPEQ